MNYFKHFYLNFMVFLRLLVMAFFHLVHGVIPLEYTSHEHWDIRFLASKAEAHK